jgi:hypothetical protein
MYTRTHICAHAYVSMQMLCYIHIHSLYTYMYAYIYARTRAHMATHHTYIHNAHKNKNSHVAGTLLYKKCFVAVIHHTTRCSLPGLEVQVHASAKAPRRRGRCLLKACFEGNRAHDRHMGMTQSCTSAGRTLFMNQIIDKRKAVCFPV